MGRMNLFKLIKYLRFKPFDVSTEAGRGQERYRLALWSFMANIISKIMALAVMLLSIRWTLPYLGAERFGVWMTVASFTTMLVVLDLGIGNALINHSAHAAAEDNPEKLKKTISGSLGFLFIISVAMGLVLSLLAAILPIEQLIKVKDANIQPEINQTLQTFAVLFGFNLFGSGVQKMFSGLQRTFEAFIASAFCSFLALICLWWASNHNASIPQLLIYSLGVQSLGGYVLLALLVKRNLFTLKGIGFEIKQEYKQLFKSGGLFFVLQIGVMVGWGADSLIISSTLGAASVAIYSITQRLFQFSSMSIGMLHAPLWGAYADANARKDKAFIRNTLLRSIKVTAFLSLLGVSILLIFNEQILQLWLTNQIAIPLAFLCAFGFWSMLESIAGALTVFLNGMHIVKPQVLSVLLFIAISLPLKFILISDYNLLAIPVATIIAYLISKVVSYGFIYLKEIKKQIF
jgi:O-antigen/teichoic acid export membrane protein